MSPPESANTGRGVYVEKPKSNIYTVLLLLSLLAILVSIVVLVLEMNEYDWDRNAPSNVMRNSGPHEYVAAVGKSPVSVPGTGLPSATLG